MSGASVYYDQESDITWKMVDAGVDRLCELLEAGTGTAYVVSEVYQAMLDAKKGSSVPLERSVEK
jgi:hypothetical protein